MSDSAWADLQDSVSSGGGHVIFSVNPEGFTCPILWKSNKIKRLIKGTLVAEALSLLLRALIRDILGMNSLAMPMEAWVDSAYSSH